MFPDVLTIFTFILFAMVISMIPLWLTNKYGTILEITLIIGTLVYMFMTFPFSEAMMLFSIVAMTYGQIGILVNKDKRKKRQQLKRELKSLPYETIHHMNDAKRIWVDLFITIVVSGGAIIFLWLAPPAYALLKFFIMLSLITISMQMIGRMGNYLTTLFYWVPDEGRLIIISAFESRDFPVQDLEKMTIDSAPDILRLHPLFTFLSNTQDYTTSVQPVLRLAFPGENIYFTPKHIQKWQTTFSQYITEAENDNSKQIFPFWHPKNLKRLFWKGYFAITVKGISAYTGLLFVLIWLDVPSYVMIVFVLCWWLFNIYVSDRVLIASTDAEELTNGELYERMKTLCKKAGIPQTKLFLIDSPIHNGLATGMNIGRGTIMITTATAQLPMQAIEAILAHEIIHVKKRDILTNQIARMVFFALLGGSVYVFFDQFILLAENLFVFIPLFYVLMLLFPMYLSMIAQYTEMRADYLGARLLDGGSQQMAEGLYKLGKAQDKELKKTFEYSMVDQSKPLKDRSNVERDRWFFRLIEFQFQSHPPLYFRIQSLVSYRKWSEVIKHWITSRISESLPDRFIRKRQ